MFFLLCIRTLLQAFGSNEFLHDLFIISSYGIPVWITTVGKCFSLLNFVCLAMAWCGMILIQDGRGYWSPIDFGDFFLLVLNVNCNVM